MRSSGLIGSPLDRGGYPPINRGLANFGKGLANFGKRLRQLGKRRDRPGKQSLPGCDGGGSSHVTMGGGTPYEKYKKSHKNTKMLENRATDHLQTL